MTIKLHLGVVDIPYTDQEPATEAEITEALRNGVYPKRSAIRGSITTGDVAEILEAKYNVMGYFFTAYQEDIADQFADALGGSLENILLGGPPPANPFAAAESAMEDMFRKFIDTKTMDGMVPGVPTAASLKGVSKRFKRKRGPVRPSFQDTGIYEASFKSWVEE